MLTNLIDTREVVNHIGGMDGGMVDTFPMIIIFHVLLCVCLGVSMAG